MEYMPKPRQTPKNTPPPPQPERTEKNTPSYFSAVTLLLIIVAFGLGLGVGYLTWGKQSGTNKPQVDLVDDDPSIGPENAPVTIVEFSDYECPYCRKWHNEVWPQLQAQYGNKIRLIYRDMPMLGGHPNAAPAAEAANCANEQNKFWEYHDLLFNGGGLSDTLYLQYATALKLDTKQFQDCLTSHKYQSEVGKDYQVARGLGVTGTPTFFINGEQVVGAQPYEVFQQYIETAMAK